MAFGDDDLDVFLDAAVFGVSVTYQSTTVTGVPDDHTEPTLEGVVSGVNAILRAVRVKTSALPAGAFAQGAALTVGGTARVVRDAIRLAPDAKHTRIYLADA